MKLIYKYSIIITVTGELSETKYTFQKGRKIMKRILSSVLCVLMTASMFVFTANAQSYQPEVADNYISFDFNQVTGGIVNRVPNATVNKNVTIEGVTAVEFVPTPNAEGAKGNLTLDCYSLANYTAKVTVPDYKYVGVTYYYKT